MSIILYICLVKRILIYIFSFYLMALSIMPCADDIEGRFISTDTSFLPTSDHSDHNSSSDHCTPFCICACCGHSISTTLVTATLSNSIVIFYYPGFKKIIKSFHFIPPTSFRRYIYQSGNLPKSVNGFPLLCLGMTINTTYVVHSAKVIL